MPGLGSKAAASRVLGSRYPGVFSGSATVPIGRFAYASPADATYQAEDQDPFLLSSPPKVTVQYLPNLGRELLLYALDVTGYATRRDLL